jgi:hypothetical protein
MLNNIAQSVISQNNYHAAQISLMFTRAHRRMGETWRLIYVGNDFDKYK